MSADMRLGPMTLDGEGENAVRTDARCPGSMRSQARPEDAALLLQGVYNLLYTHACLNAVIKHVVARHRHAKGEHAHASHAPPLEQHSRLPSLDMEMVWLFTIQYSLGPLVRLQQLLLNMEWSSSSRSSTCPGRSSHKGIGPTNAEALCLWNAAFYRPLVNMSAVLSAVSTRCTSRQGSAMASRRKESRMPGCLAM